MDQHLPHLVTHLLIHGPGNHYSQVLKRVFCDHTDKYVYIMLLQLECFSIKYRTLSPQLAVVIDRHIKY